MDQNISYNELFQHWLKEFESSDLSELSDGILKKYNVLLSYVENYEKKKDDKIKNTIILDFNNNIKYLFNDIIKIRKVKIINNALLLKEINLNRLFEAEQLFYKNLVASFKGYEKIKSISEIKNHEIDNLKINISNLDEVGTAENGTQKNSALNKDDTQDQKESSEIFGKIDYQMIRFIDQTPPLVGIDLINYGPFIKEDIANLPLKNAKILINEKFAEFIEVN
ncbi:MAG: hypothetical protein KGD63_13075 [Candidatus Lokiarchaeota archaeon]|nr:hypothetical protein [Candidatus Lokiarchaeota archaeon]